MTVATSVCKGQAAHSIMSPASLQLSWLDTLKKEEPYEDSSFTGGLEQLEKLLKRYSVVGVESTLKPSI